MATQAVSKEAMVIPKKIEASAPLFTQVTINHGPPQLLGRALLQCETEAQALGLTLSFAPMEELVAANRANADTWPPLFSAFDPGYSDLAKDNCFCILGKNAAGDVVATQAARFLDWQNTNYWDEAQSLRLMYADPAKSKLPNEECVVSAVAAKGITGRVVYSGGAWYHPTYRGQGLVSLLPRISRVLACALWDAEIVVTMMAEPVVRRGVFPRNGYTNIEWDIRMLNFRSGIARFALLWMKRNEILEDLEAFLAGGKTLQAEVQLQRIMYAKQ